MKEPNQIRLQRLADYLEVLTRAVFQAGMNWRVIEAKWPGFVEAIHRFDPDTVAALRMAQIDALGADTRLIRNRPKIEATVANARTLLRLERSNGFKCWLRQHDDYESTVHALKHEFRYIGDSSAYYFLYVVREPVPDFETWAEQRGITARQPEPTEAAAR